MKRILFRLSLARALGLGLAAFLTLPAAGQSPVILPGVAQTQPDVADANAKKAAAALANPKKLDVTKFVVIERPVKAAIANSAPVPSAAKADANENPTVKAGDVKWHESFAVAIEASKKSGKPVLLLHMMGRLDKQFC